VPNYILGAQAGSNDELLCISDSRPQIESLINAIGIRMGVNVAPSSPPPVPPGPPKAGLTTEVIEQAKTLKTTGALIDAIKLVRNHSDMGLREAKEYVERL
jgi:ribosomal protein L7/L12